MKTKQLLHETGLTYRQLDYWISADLIPGAKQNLGSGRRREFNEGQELFVKTMAKLVFAGFRPEAAARIVPNLTGTGIVTLDLGNAFLSIAMVEK